MDQNSNVRVVEEEEKSGWTLLSTVHDDELGEKPSAPQEPDPELHKVTDEGTVDSLVTEGICKEENEDSDDTEEFLHAEEDADADDELTDCGLDEGAEDDAFVFSDSARAYVWESDSGREGSAKQVLVEQQVGQKQGLVWRVSLVATLGFFGWAVLSGLGGGGKNIRCLKMHPCSLKEGEPVLSTL